MFCETVCENSIYFNKNEMMTDFFCLFWLVYHDNCKLHSVDTE